MNTYHHSYSLQLSVEGFSVGKISTIIFLLTVPAGNRLILIGFRFGVPVRCVLDRDEDMLITGKRTPLLAKYKVGFASDGIIKALDVQLYTNAGCATDISESVSWTLKLCLRVWAIMIYMTINMNYYCHDHSDQAIVSYHNSPSIFCCVTPMTLWPLFCDLYSWFIVICIPCLTIRLIMVSIFTF